MYGSSARISLLKAGPAFMEPTDLESDTKALNIFTCILWFYTSCANQILLFVDNVDTY
jgi:hypothetical protein